MMPSHWCQHHVMWTAPSNVPLHSIGNDEYNDVQHDIFGHVTPFLGPVLASCYANSVINGATAFLRS